MRDQYYRMGQGFLLVYSIQSKLSFEEAKEIHEQLLRLKDAEWVPMVGISLFKLILIDPCWQ